MSPVCRDCGSEKVGWDKTKAGHHYLRDFGQPHNNTCPAKTAAKKKELVPSAEPESLIPFSAGTSDAEKKSLEVAIAKALIGGNDGQD